MAQGSATDPEPEWVTLPEAAARLGLSVAWFRIYAKASGVEVRKRGGLPGGEQGIPRPVDRAIQD